MSEKGIYKEQTNNGANQTHDTGMNTGFISGNAGNPPPTQQSGQTYDNWQSTVTGWNNSQKKD